MKTKAQLRRAGPADLPAIRALLAAAGLPADDLDRAPVEFVVAVADGRLAGVAGVEALAPGMVMVRSFAVEPALQHNGIGGALLAQLLAGGRQKGVTDFFLLTMTARQFFSSRGFSVLPRERAPAPVRAHPQFTGLCPQQAALMHFDARLEEA